MPPPPFGVDREKFTVYVIVELKTIHRKREERKPTRCNNIDDLLSIVDVDY